MNPLLDLDQALTTEGWCTQLRADGPVPLLRVWHPSTPWFGDSVSPRTGPDGTSAFYTRRWPSATTSRPRAGP